MNPILRRITKGSGASGLSLVARTCEQLFLVPILLSSWSTGLYGEWILISAIPVYFTMSDFGFLTAGSNELARRESQEGEPQALAFFKDFTAAFFGWSLLVAAAICFVVPFAPIHSWLDLSFMTSAEASFTFLALLLAALLTMNGEALLAGLRVRKLFHIGLLIRAGSAYLKISLIFVAVYFFHQKTVSVAFISTLVCVFEYMIFHIILYKLSFSPSFLFFKKRREKMSAYLKMGLEFLLLPLAYALSIQGTTIVVGSVVGAVAVAMFNTHRTLARTATSVLQMFVRPLRAEAGLLQRREDIPELGNLLVRLSRVTFWISILIAIPLVVLGHQIFLYWTQGKIEFSSFVFIFLIFASVLEGIWRIASSIRLGSNRHRPIVYGFAVISVMGIGLSIILGHLFGVGGVAVSIVLSNVVMCLLTISFTASLLEMNSISYVGNFIRPPVDEVRALLRYARRGR